MKVGKSQSNMTESTPDAPWNFNDVTGSVNEVNKGTRLPLVAIETRGNNWETHFLLRFLA